MTLLDALFTIIVYAKKPEPKITPTPIVARREVIDPRLIRLRAYLRAKESPLVESAHTFIRVADKYKLPWTLLPAIAGVESGFEKAGNTTDYNPFGYMCKNGPCPFDSYDDSIEAVGNTIGTANFYAAYRASGQVSVLALTYNVAAPEDWTSKIIYFQNEIR